jgi:hypothetical protein
LTEAFNVYVRGIGSTAWIGIIMRAATWKYSHADTYTHAHANMADPRWRLIVSKSRFGCITASRGYGCGSPNAA